MSHKCKTKKRGESVFFGVILVFLGTVFLLDRFDVLRVGRIWSWWPLIPIAMGWVRILGWESAESVASGLGWALFGGWFLICQMGWFDLSWQNSWPIVLVAIGVSMVTRALLEPVFRDRQKEGGDVHA